MIRSLYVFDCDGTILNTFCPEEGKPIWEKYHNVKYTHKGWWGREESLDPKVFEVKEIEGIRESYNHAKSDPEGMVIMLTSRMPKLKDLIIFHLDKNNFKFDDYIFKYGRNEKPDQINKILIKYDSIEYVRVYDDRDKEIILYKSWKPIRDINLDIIQVFNKK
jgi:hypothetical protein